MRFVNMYQTSDERRDKYRKLKLAGFNVRMAQRARDWTWNHVNLLISSYQF